MDTKHFDRQGQTRFVSVFWAVCDENASTTC